MHLPAKGTGSQGNTSRLDNTSIVDRFNQLHDVCFNFLQNEQTRTNDSCDYLSSWPNLDNILHTYFSVVIIGIYIPFLTMLFSYSQICIRLWGRKGERSSIENDQSGKKKRSIKMIILATSLFFISWFPYTLLYLLMAMKAWNSFNFG